MKRFSAGLAIIGLVCFSNLIAAPSKSNTAGTIITSSGTASVTFDKYTSEIYWVRNSTSAIYIDFYSATCSSSTYSIKVFGGSATSGTVEANTITMSIWSENFPVEVLINGRSNK